LFDQKFVPFSVEKMCDGAGVEHGPMSVVAVVTRMDLDVIFLAHCE